MLHALAAALAAVCALGGAGCVEPTKAAPEPVVLRIGLATTPQGLTVFRNGLLYETLMTTAADGRQRPRVFDSWAVTDDGLSVRFHVSSGLKFHDGSVADAPLIQRALLGQIKAGTLRADRIASIEAPTAEEVLIRLRQPDSLLLPTLSDSTLRHPDRPAVGTGPFRAVASAEAAAARDAAGGPVTLRRFEDYHGGPPAIDQVVITPYATQRNAWAAMMRKEIDYLHEVSRESVDFVEAESSIRVYSIPRPYYVALVFNVRHPVLKIREVRRGLSQGVDREAIIKLGFNGRGTPGTGAIWPKNWAYSTAVPAYSYNPDAAKLRLDAAGFEHRRPTIAGQKPARFRFSCLVRADDPRYDRAALVLQRQLFEIGVDMELEAVGFAELIQRMQAGRFDAVLTEFASGRTLDYPYFWFRSPSAGANPLNTGYTAADDALDRMRQATTDDAVRLAVSDAQRVMYEDPPAVFLAWQQNLRAVGTQYEVPVDSDRDLMATIARWRPRVLPVPAP
jgi:peptide/nickel transport system substrate-binding protein